MKKKPRNPYVVAARTKKAGVHTSKDKKKGGRRGGSRRQNEYDEEYARCEKQDGGTVYYDQAGNIHRVGGPALITRDNYIYYLRHGQFHREDGPAINTPSGIERWYLYNKQVDPFTPEQLPLILLKLSLEELP